MTDDSDLHLEQEAAVQWHDDHFLSGHDHQQSCSEHKYLGKREAQHNGPL